MAEDEVVGRAIDALAALEEDQQKAKRLLPSWFVPRMMEDNWFFGLLLTNDTILGIATITGVDQAADGSIWLEVEMLEHPPIIANQFMFTVKIDDRNHYDAAKIRVMSAPTSRLTASINAAHVIAAFEIADT